MQLRHERFLLHQQGVQTRAVEVVETIALEALGQACRDHVHLTDRIFGMLSRGPRQIGDHVLGIAEGVSVVTPDPPTLD
ncbi:hypothetical protein D3C78_1789370 [compost metagenome]